ncbi:glutaredoxin [Coniophora puteana RWD-64-598 SS2]|uniref:Monothiol glutaredoxin-5, mitochondrial n=1 Tax=Coniophora puteana (strain RWD-64-598) TaxID=741705 RepID=A0A5M3MHT5_CONPW|nr:glutaredoxin [Coniophora puteana RWD-64-598 SS2]EIW78500.1 glutaredoxin [Coniophora puteana RWD-64-598 SS2]
MLRGALRSSVSSALRASARGPSPLALAQQRWISNDMRTKLQSAVDAHPVVVFMKGTPDMPQCGFSRAACQVLSLSEVPEDKLKTFNVLEDQELRDSIKEFSDWPTIPQVYVKGEFVGGADVVIDMWRNGQFRALLEEHNIVPKMTVEETKSQPNASS